MLLIDGFLLRTAGFSSNGYVVEKGTMGQDIVPVIWLQPVSYCCIIIFFYSSIGYPKLTEINHQGKRLQAFQLNRTLHGLVLDTTKTMIYFYQENIWQNTHLKIPTL